MHNPQPGHNVEVVLRGVVDDTNPQAFRFSKGDSRLSIQLDSDLIADIVRLPDPDPAWYPPLHGDVAVVANTAGHPVAWDSSEGLWRWPSGAAYTGQPSDLTLRLRGGAPV